MRLKNVVHANVRIKFSDKSESFKLWNGKETEGKKGWEAYKFTTFFVSENKSRLTNEFYITYTVPCDTASTTKTK